VVVNSRNVLGKAGEVRKLPGKIGGGERAVNGGVARFSPEIYVRSIDERADQRADMGENGVTADGDYEKQAESESGLD
jgi:hypothetical protein